jgi:NAD(P)-dependent dehydrogenase (short-subunit alcohol dehydrogenase family)
MSKVYVVIGGSRGIGAGIVNRLAAGGNEVHVYCRTVGQLESIDGVRHVACDVVNDDLSVDMFPSVIDGLAYCPGSFNAKSIRALSIETLREDFEINVVGAVKSIQTTLSALKKSTFPSASVVLFSTVAVAQGMNAHASIAASKGAIEGLTKTLAAELSPKIRVNCIAPALTQTSLMEKLFTDPAKVEAMGAKYPLGRTGTVVDLAAAACFLLGDDSLWITGQVLGVDGGMSTVKKL